MFTARSKAQADKGSRIGNNFRLPSLVGLVFAHGGLGAGIPRSGRFTGQVVLPKQSGLDLVRALVIDCLLATRFAGLLAAVGTLVQLAGVSLRGAGLLFWRGCGGCHRGGQHEASCEDRQFPGQKTHSLHLRFPLSWAVRCAACLPV